MDYKLMCFPCLRKKKKMSSFDVSSSDLEDHFEYIVDKYTIRKIPVSFTGDSEGLMPQQAPDDADLNLSTSQEPHMEGRGEFPKIVLPGAYSVPRVTPVLPVTTHSSRSVKEKPRPEDILDPTPQVPRRPVMKPNYVAIPSKASLHAKDIMLTKREITNQYLNNFSSVFVDNLKDQVPKDPETYPRLSRPYTSALKNMYVKGAVGKGGKGRKSDNYRSKANKLVYSLPERSTTETACEPDGGEYPNSIDDASTVPVHSIKKVSGGPGQEEAVDDTSASPYQELLKDQSSGSENEFYSEDSKGYSSSQPPPQSSSSLRRITYEDIQALDVGYDFSSSERYGVKPKKTRIRITNVETGRPWESCARAVHLPLLESELSRRHADSSSSRGSRTRSPSQTTGRIPTTKVINFHNDDAAPYRRHFSDRHGSDDQQMRLRHFLNNSCFVSHSINTPMKAAKPSQDSRADYFGYYKDGVTDYHKSDSEKDAGVGNYSHHRTFDKTESDQLVSSTELNGRFIGNKMPKIGRTCLKQTNRPSSASSEKSGTHLSSTRRKAESFHHSSMLNPSSFYSFKNAGLYRSRSFESLCSAKKEEQITPKPVPFARNQKRLDEPETETSNSICSRESKTSSLVTSPVTSEPEVNKKATLRWKIIIKHRKDDARDTMAITVPPSN